MKYIIITLLFLSSCATNDIVELHNTGSTRVTPDDLGDNDLEHRLKAQELGISYVDYLHLLNNNKTKVNRSYFKLRHDHNE